MEVKDLKTYFFVRRGIAKAVDGVSFKLDKGKVLGLVGESGCGKSVTAMSILRLIPSPPGKIVGGEILFHGQDASGRETAVDLLKLSQKEMRKFRGKQISVVLQDPMTSLNPVFTIGNQVGEPFRLHEKLSGAALLKKIIEVLKRVRIPNPEVRIADYPHQFSGGMRQRVSTAMGIGCNPHLLIADEPTTALDVTIQAQILNLLEDIQEKFGLTYLIISHDLAVVEHVADTIGVMYLGKLVELAPAESLYAEAQHPYTRALLAAVPIPDPDVEVAGEVLGGEVPSPLNPPTGCRFHPRCLLAKEICLEEEPELVEITPGHKLACHNFE